MKIEKGRADILGAAQLDLGEVARALRAGATLLYPTETFYGLGASVDCPESLDALARIKVRDGGKPFPVIAADEAAARSLWAEVPPLAALLMARFWPGPLTLVLPARPGLSPRLSGAAGVGVRVSPHPIARALAERAGPLAATSANFSGEPAPRRLAQLPRGLLASVDLAIDAGETAGGTPSTVARVEGDRLVVLREGAVSERALRAAIEAGWPSEAARRGAAV